MVVALKELSIRGDFRTTVEYLIKLLETPAFEDNTITTGWLDELISNKLTAERPDPMLAVVCGAVYQGPHCQRGMHCRVPNGLEKGQVPSKDILKTVFPIDFIYEGTDTSSPLPAPAWTATTSSSTAPSALLVSVPLADGGLLVLLSGTSHNVYWKEEVGCYPFEC